MRPAAPPPRILGAIDASPGRNLRDFYRAVVQLCLDADLEIRPRSLLSSAICHARLSPRASFWRDRGKVFEELERLMLAIDRELAPRGYYFGTQEADGGIKTKLSRSVWGIWPIRQMVGVSAAEVRTIAGCPICGAAGQDPCHVVGEPSLTLAGPHSARGRT